MHTRSSASGSFAHVKKSYYFSKRRHGPRQSGVRSLESVCKLKYYIINTFRFGKRGEKILEIESDQILSVNRSRILIHGLFAAEECLRIEGIRPECKAVAEIVNDRGTRIRR